MTMTLKNLQPILAQGRTVQMCIIYSKSSDLDIANCNTFYACANYGHMVVHKIEAEGNNLIITVD